MSTDPAATTIRPGADWQTVEGFSDVRYELSGDGLAKISLMRIFVLS